MNRPENRFPAGLLEPRDGPCLSLYQPTARRHPDNQQDPIRFRNLVRRLESTLRTAYAGHDPARLLEPFHALADDRAFWNCTLDGLGVLAADGLFRVYRVARPVPEVAVVSDSFHLKPLLRILQSADRFQVLGINRHGIRLFEGNRDGLAEIEPAPEVPRTIEAALGSELTDPHHEVATYGSGPVGPAMVHGHGGRKDQVDKDAERWFRAVDRAVFEHHSRPTALPLVLAALPEHHALFREVSRNPQLLERAVDTHPDDLDAGELARRSWRAVEPLYTDRLDALVEEFGGARAHGLGTDDLSLAAAASLDGRVETLLVDADRRIPGRIDADTRAVELSDEPAAAVDDLLDDLGEQVLRTGGRVVVVPGKRMPTRTGIAATLRF